MDERELIQKSAHGDEAAFSDLMAHNKAMVYRHCLAMVHDQEIAEDLTQETFVHAYQHLGTFRMESRFSTWLWRISHNLTLNFLKKQKHEQEFREELLPPSYFVREEVDDEKMLRIQEAIDTLSPKHKIVFEMYDLKHIPQKEIAAELGISHGTVRSRIHYARKKIREFLENK